MRAHRAACFIYRLADIALVVAQHKSCLNVIYKGPELISSKHVQTHAPMLASWGHGEHNPSCIMPRLKLKTLRHPKLKHTTGIDVSNVRFLGFSRII